MRSVSSVSTSQPNNPSEPVEIMWLGSSERIRRAVEPIQRANSSLFSSLNARGSLQICHEKMAGSSLYFRFV